MKRLYNLSLFVFLLFSLVSYGQRNCGTMEYLEYMQQKYPEIIQNMQEIEEHTQKNLGKVGDKIVITIPTVVHVVYRNQSQNISDDQINSQIQVLNEDFGTIFNTSSLFGDVAADVELAFCLATVDPDGNPTDGIERRQSNKPSWGTNNNVKKYNKGGLNAWNADEYLNIWVCNIGQGLLGYAQFPGGPKATDGVVVTYLAFGKGNQYNLYDAYDEGRTTTHEVGHWLNLYHTFQGGCAGTTSSNCGTGGDRVCDTPPVSTPNYTASPCNQTRNSCSEFDDKRDMFENYMDYSNDACMDLFTIGQKDRMRTLFSTGGARASLADSGGCGGSGGGGGPDPEICDDGIDNDGDELVDCADPDCENFADCQSTGPCELPAPTGLVATGINKKKATLNWNDVTGAASYEARYAKEGTNNWSTKSTSNTSVNATGLKIGDTYDWEVRSICNDGTGGDWSITCQFIADDNSSGECLSTRVANFSGDVQVYPNPANTRLMVEYFELPAVSEDMQLHIMDVHGRLLRNVPLNRDAGYIELDVAELPNGLYLMRISDANGQLSTSKFLINH